MALAGLSVAADRDSRDPRVCRRAHLKRREAGAARQRDELEVPRFAGLAVHPVQPAPPIHLDNNLGQPITLSQYRGKVVLVTFLYAHCPDVCPLIAGNLHTTLAELGPRAGHVQLIAVSVDPHGDTAGAVAMLSQRA